MVTPLIVFQHVTAATGTRRRLRGGLGNHRALEVGGVTVRFYISVDVREAAAASGATYAINGPAGDDAWATANTSLIVAQALVEDMAEALAAATEEDGSRRLSTNARLTKAGLTAPHGRRLAESTWDAAAAAVVAAMPVAATGGALSLKASPGTVSYRPDSVVVTICRFDDPCIAPTPGPTVARPSQVSSSATQACARDGVLLL